MAEADYYGDALVSDEDHDEIGSSAALNAPSRSKAKVLVVMLLVLFEPALIMVDHVYIRFTGMSLGALFISVALIKRGKLMEQLC